MTARIRGVTVTDTGRLDRLVTVRRKVIAAGHSHRVASGLCAWLVTLIAGDTDATASDTRARYRTILREITAPDGDEGNAPAPIEDRWVRWILGGS